MLEPRKEKELRIPSIDEFEIGFEYLINIKEDGQKGFSKKVVVLIK